MKKEILIATTDDAFSHVVHAALSESGYAVRQINSVEALIKQVQSGGHKIVLLDLDALALNNNQIKEIRRKNPKTVLIGSSKRKFHPELKESLSQYLFACMTKPIDTEELQYLLKGIGNATDAKRSRTI